MARSFGCWRIEGVGGGLIEIAAALNLRAQSCVKVELDVMGSPSLISLMFSGASGKEQVQWSTQVASHWRGLHLLNLYCSGGGWLTVSSVFTVRSCCRSVALRPQKP